MPHSEPLIPLVIIGAQGHKEVPLSMLREFYTLMADLEVHSAQLVLEIDQNIVELMKMLQTKDEQGKALLANFIKGNLGRKIVLIDAILLKNIPADVFYKLAELVNKGFTPDEAALMLDAVDRPDLPKGVLLSYLGQN